eukprot:scaffold40203_cov48-Cyclotella_meneghiniana.AAC.2
MKYEVHAIHVIWCDADHAPPAPAGFSISIMFHSLHEQIHSSIATTRNCTSQFYQKKKHIPDIAMSYIISSLTRGKPLLLADYWAVKSMSEIYSKDGISGAKSHLDERHGCVTNLESCWDSRMDQNSMRAD